MHKLFKILLSTLTALVISVSSATAFELTGVGASLMYGNVETDGTETERTVSGVTSEKNSASKSESYLGGSIFIEGSVAGLTVGLDVVPFEIDLGDGKRTDTTTDANESTQEDGTVSAKATLDFLTTLYVHYPIGDWYGLLGYHFTDVKTEDKLHTSSYGDESISGIQIGFGKNAGNLRYELSYSDFEDISLTGSNGDKIDADADNLMFKLSYVVGN